MWKVARIGRGKHQKAWKEEIRREHNSNPLQRNSHVHFTAEADNFRSSLILGIHNHNTNQLKIN